MDTKDLLAEIRENRTEIRKLHTDFYLFKGKAYGFIAIMSIIINISIAYLTKAK